MTEDPRSRASIVIPAFNEAFLTRVCLLSLRLADLAGAQVVVVDNGSSDGTAGLLHEWECPDQGRIAVRLPQNLGFARGCNAGAEASSGEFLIFLNNDTFVEPDWLANLLRPFADPEVMITGCRLLYPNGRIQHAGVAFIPDGPGQLYAGLPGDFPPALEERTCQAVTGAALAIRRQAFAAEGGFDDHYLNSYEDVDLCLKVGRRGGKIVYVPDAVAHHWESMSQGRLSDQDRKNRELFLSRWKGRFDADYEGLMKAAEDAGYDLSQRLPSRREQHDRLVAMEASEAEVARLAAELGSARAQLSRRSARIALRTALWIGDRVTWVRRRGH